MCLPAQQLSSEGLIHKNTMPRPKYAMPPTAASNMFYGGATVIEKAPKPSFATIRITAKVRPATCCIKTIEIALSLSYITLSSIE